MRLSEEELVKLGTKVDPRAILDGEFFADQWGVVWKASGMPSTLLAEKGHVHIPAHQVSIDNDDDSLVVGEKSLGVEVPIDSKCIVITTPSDLEELFRCEE